MSLRLKAPLPSARTTTILPSPQLADVEGRKHEVDIFRATDGTLRTSVKSNDRRLLTYTLDLDPLKAEELIAFLKSYHSSKIGLNDHKGQDWEVYLAGNPVALAGKSAKSVTLQIQFEGTKVS